MNKQNLERRTDASFIVKGSAVIVPVVTPLTERFALDEEAVRKIFNNLYRHQVTPFVLGTTGESASLALEIKRKYIKEAGRLKPTGTILYAGISSNCFRESVALAKFCFDHGADAVVSTLPSYYLLSVDQMRDYFISLADAVKGPLVIYNIPATTHMSIPLPLLDELSHHPHIIATKDSERSEERLRQSLVLWKERKDFGHFLGWAARSAEALFNGTDGLVPSTANLVPEIYAVMLRAVGDGDRDKAFAMQELSDVYGNLYQSGKTLGESLWALKLLMQEESLCQSNVMPPLQALPAAESDKLKKEFHDIKNKNAVKTI